MTNTLIIRRCATLNEAYISADVLRFNGILATLDNAHHAGLDWFSVQALGGVHVRVPTSQYQEAKSVIIEQLENAPIVLAELGFEPDPPTKSRYWRAASMLLIYLGFLYFPAYFLIAWLDAILPRTWFPEPEPSFGIWINQTTVSPAVGMDGLVFVMVMSMLLIWELITTRPDKPAKAPQP